MMMCMLKHESVPNLAGEHEAALYELKYGKTRFFWWRHVCMLYAISSRNNSTVQKFFFFFIMLQ